MLAGWATVATGQLRLEILMSSDAVEPFCGGLGVQNSWLKPSDGLLLCSVHCCSVLLSILGRAYLKEEYFNSAFIFSSREVKNWVHYLQGGVQFWFYISIKLIKNFN